MSEVKASPVTGTVLVSYDQCAVSPRVLELVAKHSMDALRVIPADSERSEIPSLSLAGL